MFERVMMRKPSRDVAPLNPSLQAWMAPPSGASCSVGGALIEGVWIWRRRRIEDEDEFE
jgi:hypothetical protein